MEPGGGARPIADSPAARFGRTLPNATLGLLGGFELRLKGRVVELPLAAKRLLVFLALRHRSLARTFVSQSLWLESTEKHADGNLRSALWRVARLSSSLIDSRGGQLALDASVSVDLYRSVALAERLIEAPESIDETDMDRKMLCEDILPDWSEEWMLAERELYRQLRLHGLERQCERLTSLGRFGRAVQAGLEAVSGEPLRESANLILISAHVAEGNTGEAIRQYHSYRGLLWSELGASPSDAMRQLVRGLGVLST